MTLPKIKALVWEHRPAGVGQYERWIAQTLIGEFRIMLTPDGYRWHSRYGGIMHSADDLEAAQKAANLEFAGHILGVVETGPQATPEAVAWMRTGLNRPADVALFQKITEVWEEDGYSVTPLYSVHVPQTIWIVNRMSGEYDEIREDDIAAYADEALARAHVDGAERWWKENIADPYLALRAEGRVGTMDLAPLHDLAAINPWDPGMSGIDERRYMCFELPVSAQLPVATEAAVVEADAEACPATVSEAGGVVVQFWADILPEGWTIVPEKITEAMLCAFCGNFGPQLSVSRAEMAWMEACDLVVLPPIPHLVAPTSRALQHEERVKRFDLEWDAAPRPGVHQNPMRGRQSFPFFKKALKFMRRQPADATFVSLVQVTSNFTDRSAEVRQALGLEQRDSEDRAQ